MTAMTIRIPRRALTLLAASGLALGGAAALATGWSASASQGKDTVHQVWVCKYVQKPSVNEVLKGGKNPIFVDWHSLTGKGTAPKVGDTFSDAQLKSVVVKIGGTSPGVKACGAVTPPKTTTAPPTMTTTAPPTKTTTAPPATTGVPEATTTAAGGGGGGVTGPTPGASAPATGGDGDPASANALLGSGLLAGGLALAATEALRRRREHAPR